ncbi:family 20 glycosylhydrolase [Carboxylicivirga sp. N1Y90]|uniref:family 20 glycosylhydrolase n=1 Tax=Carboxylicivirga fragile TaxID=3417571 RepID=UPI003D34716C|nr:family 20 glycosylhydrolase [Marinilabiliaceae bacterium N1Y90]
MKISRSVSVLSYKWQLLCFVLLLIASNNFASTQQSDLQLLALSIKENPQIKIGDKTIQYPSVSKDYQISLIGSDRVQVIDNEGNIFPPMVDVPVNLYYQLMDRKTKERVDIPNIKVVVPGVEKVKEAGNAIPQTIPKLREWLGGEGYYAFKQKGKIVVDAKCWDEVKSKAITFAEDLKWFNKKNFTVQLGASENADIFLTINKELTSLGDEGYTLNIDEQITIEASSPQGLFWGTRTVLQLINVYGNELPKGLARDYPKYKRRGFMIDVGRKFFTIDFLRQYVRIMSYYKFNEFQIHLNDNGLKWYFDNDWDKVYSAFRLESESYPELTAKDGSYTKLEFTDLQRLGMQYGINVIPEIDAPAHSLAFSKCRPDLASEKYGADHLDINNPEVYTFLDELYEEYLGGDSPVFIGPDMHIGTDEYDKSEAESFRKFTDYYLKKVQSYGKRARLWGSLTHADGETPVTSDNVIMNAWYNGYADPATMIEQGYELISTSDRHLYIVPAAGYYFDYLETDFLYHKWEPNLIGGAEFPLGHPQISGGMFAVWNDLVGNGISEKDVHHRAMPAIQVIGQKMWHGIDHDVSLIAFQELASRMDEAPFVNMMGKIKHKGEFVLNYDFLKSGLKDLSGNGFDLASEQGVKWQKGKGYIFSEGQALLLPIEEVGYNYEVSFDIEFDEVPEAKTTLFNSSNAQLVILPLNDSIQIGFERDGYSYTFKKLFEHQKQHAITISGDNKGTSLLINNKEVERLEGSFTEHTRELGTSSKLYKKYYQQTLVFPLKSIGNFNGSILNLKVKQIK